MKDETWIRDQLQKVNNSINERDHDWRMYRFKGIGLQNMEDKDIIEMMDMTAGYRELVGRRDVLKEILED